MATTDDADTQKDDLIPADQTHSLRGQLGMLYEAHITNEAIPRSERTLAGFINRLKLEPAEYRQFMSWGGDALVTRNLYEKIEQSLRTYLSAKNLSLDSNELPRKETSPASGYDVVAQSWVLIPSNPAIKEKILELSRLLEEILDHATRTNLPIEAQAISQIERAQLIALLETTLHILKAPMIEKGLITSTREALRKAASSTIEKQAEQGLGIAATFAVQKIVDLLRLIFF